MEEKYRYGKGDQVFVAEEIFILDWSRAASQRR
jgi:hypothetical protein